MVRTECDDVAFQHHFFRKVQSLNEEEGYKRIVNWPIFRDSLALGNGDNY